MSTIARAPGLRLSDCSVSGAIIQQVEGMLRQVAELHFRANAPVHYPKWGLCSTTRCQWAFAAILVNIKYSWYEK